MIRTGRLLVLFTVALSTALGAAAVPVRAQEPCVVFDDFSTSKVGEFPVGWKPRKDSGKDVYKVAEDGGHRFLRADAKDLGVQAGKQFEWNLKEYPILAWAWRPREFPKDADERTKKNDSALSVYAVFPNNMFSVKTVKYIWSEKVPVGTLIPQTSGLTQGIVLKSGPPAGGGWVEERVNVVEDYKRTFKVDAVPKPDGIAVLTDSDDTSSRARGDYATFRVCRS